MVSLYLEFPWPPRAHTSVSPLASEWLNGLAQMTKYAPRCGWRVSRGSSSRFCQNTFIGGHTCPSTGMITTARNLPPTIPITTITASTPPLSEPILSAPDFIAENQHVEGAGAPRDAPRSLSTLIFIPFLSIIISHHPLSSIVTSTPVTAVNHCHQ